MNDIIKILKSKPENIYSLLKELDNKGILNIILPELVKLKGRETKNGISHKDNFLHTLKVVEKTYYKTNNIWLRFASIIHDIGKFDTKKWQPGIGWTFHNHEFIGYKKVKGIFKRFNLDRSKLSYVEKIVKYHGRIKELKVDGSLSTDSALRRFDKKIGKDLEDLILFCKCDITTKYKEKEEKMISDLDDIYNKILDIRKLDEKSKWRPPINGNEIMEILNLKPGKKLGEIIKTLNNKIKSGEIKDDYNSAYNFILKFKGKV